MASNFHLEVGADRLATLTFDSPEKKLNVFTRTALQELETVLQELAGRQDIGCLVLLSGKPAGFIAGADVDEIARVTDPVEAEAGSRVGHRLFAAWEALPFPTVAAIRGVCLGGGLEISLASTFRVASDRPDTKLGLPEVQLGILPGWGGSTRLPRLIGIADALDLILTGRTVDGRKALKLGLVDALLPDVRFLDEVRNFALAHLGSKHRDEAGTDFKEMLLEKNPVGRKILFDQARKKTLEQSRGHYPAPLRAIEVVRVGIEQGVKAGFDAEARAVSELATSKISKNLLHVFHLTENAKKEAGLPGAEPRKIKSTAVLGAGVMGGGIAQLIADKTNLPVRMKDVRDEALAAGMMHAAELFDKQVKRRRLSIPESKRKMALLLPTLDFSGFARADLVIEAIVENLGVKQDVFAETAKHVRADTVLASNTSSLSIAGIGAKTPERGRVVGMHFFNPVGKMPLVEVIAPEGSDPVAVNTVFAYTRKLGKTPILVSDTPGFLVNRLLMFYSTEALWLLDEGYKMEDLDRTMSDWGMPVGPITLTDEVGIDVATKVAHILRNAFGGRLPVPAWLDKVPGSGRLGTKNGKGFYLYEGKERRGPDPSLYTLLGLHPTVENPDPELIADRMVLPMVNEAARCLEEKVARNASDVDLALIFGTGFPPFRGGLCRWADQEGLGQIIATLERLESSVGDRFQPSDELRRTAEAGGFYARFG
ncbi:MAG TPA: 3-hydroxyacyl-CoA dehydrogenase NAD-binding domain-containing protein [Thermoanaerobaculia bacterium]|jgi:3-hydroxyacyl-CoA dehydrogenase/enoyl-CoA hydratase/3-hydroxybutyryl-CoA epimerase|nr:3-hydroxyacyl-CoA dehydrogenase NAD-binding domain-containing protein [Thermoanaerobaculia bacterium]